MVVAPSILIMVGCFPHRSHPPSLYSICLSFCPSIYLPITQAARRQEHRGPAFSSHLDAGVAFQERMLQGCLLHDPAAWYINVASKQTLGWPVSLVVWVDIAARKICYGTAGLAVRCSKAKQLAWEVTYDMYIQQSRARQDPIPMPMPMSMPTPTTKCMPAGICYRRYRTKFLHIYFI